MNLERQAAILNVLDNEILNSQDTFNFTHARLSIGIRKMGVIGLMRSSCRCSRKLAFGKDLVLRPVVSHRTSFSTCAMNPVREGA